MKRNLRSIVRLLTACVLVFSVLSYHSIIVLAQINTRDVSLGTIQRVLPAVVTITISKPIPRYRVTYQNILRVPVYERIGTRLATVGAGSGFIISHNGTIVTAKHVVNDPEATYTVMFSDGSSASASVTYIDPTNDIALVKVNGNFPTIASLVDSNYAWPGTKVSSIGNQSGKYANSFSNGTITSRNVGINASGDNFVEKLDNLIESNAAVTPGFSGGPLINASGQVIGLTVAKDNQDNTSYAIPSSIVRSSIAGRI
jgi:S1-C subfamily serine protease